MIRYYTSSLVLLLASGCQTVSNQQRTAVNQFAAKTVEFSSSPKVILEELSAIRESRGIYYAASFTDPELHLAELDNLTREKSQDDKFAGKAGIAFRVLEEYAAGLQRLSDDKPFQKLEEGYGKAGKDLEKLVALYNEVDGTEQVPEGIGILFAKSAQAATGACLARRQVRALREFVLKADTMVAVLCGEMANVLSKQKMGKLIEQEESGLTESFRFYYTRHATASTEPGREYVALKKRLNDLTMLREKTVRASQQLRVAHKKLVEEIYRKQKIKELADELVNYYREAEEIRKLVRKLQ